MPDMLENRVLKEAEYITENNETIRKTAVIFGLSKSTVHFDLAVRLPKISGILYSKVKELLQFNLSVRYLRGGEATRQKFASKTVKKSLQKNKKAVKIA